MLAVFMWKGKLNVLPMARTQKAVEIAMVPTTKNKNSKRPVLLD